ncbi:hypothetical protein SLS53_002456 [Cytospora paraplurivora]|uniref:Uncharacterized protein n=1 Tax=Cytospora paraplurivora TaxID=2898453 RepID=A0AAN9UF08_9PEZI
MPFNDVSKTPPPLPSPELTDISSGISLLRPLSRRGTGPGMIILTLDHNDPLAIRKGVPSQLMKWAEEGYTVVEIQARALLDDNGHVIPSAVKALESCEKCEPKGKIGLVGNTPTPARSTHENNSDFVKQYYYPKAASYLFATPFHDAFHYNTEAISHTRNLTFFKPTMGGPFFDLETIWEEHTYYEFADRSLEHTMSTMVQEPYVNHVPTMTGGIGRESLSHFYLHNFIFSNSADAELELISRTIGIDRVVDEFIFNFTHDQVVDWM